MGMLKSDTADAPVPNIEIGGMRVDVRDASSRLRRGAANSITVSGYVQHIRNFWIQTSIDQHSSRTRNAIGSVLKSC